MAITAGSVPTPLKPASDSWDKATLLTLDNVDNRLHAAATFAKWALESVANLRIVATSREPLGVPGERVLRLRPLEVPPPQMPLIAAQAIEFCAVQLFAERASAGQHTFELTDSNVPMIAQICRRLDGLPLAIELAAACVPGVGLKGLAVPVDDLMNLLTRGWRTAAPRHQSLRAVLDSAYEALSPRQQWVLRRLSVFSGKFTARSAGMVIGDEQLPRSEVRQIVAQLAAKSIVREHRAPPFAFQLFNTWHAYSLAKLRRTAEYGEVRFRHALPVC